MQIARTGGIDGGAAIVGVVVCQRVAGGWMRNKCVDSAVFVALKLSARKGGNDQNGTLNFLFLDLT